MLYELFEVAFFTIIVEWLVVFIVTKTRLIDKFMPKQDTSKSYIQFKAGGIDAHLEGNVQDGIQSILKLFFPEESTDKKIENIIERNINKNTESIVNVMLSNKNIQKQLQKQIFMTIKDKLNMTMIKNKKG